MVNILIIDGGEDGKRLEIIRNTIREISSRTEVSIKFSSSNLDQNGVFHSLENYHIAFIHNSDNIDNVGRAIYENEAERSGAKLFLFSGGFLGCEIASNNVCKINDHLLLENIREYFCLLRRNHYNIFNFEYLYPGINYLLLESLFNLRESIIKWNLDTEFSTDDQFSNSIDKIKSFINLIDTESNKAFIQIISGILKFIDDNNNFKLDNSNEINKIILKYEKHLSQI